MCFVLSPKILVGLCKNYSKIMEEKYLMIEDCAISQIFQHPLSVVCFIFLFLQNAKIDPQLRNIQQAQNKSERDSERERKKRERKRENVLLNRAPCTRSTPN